MQTRCINIISPFGLTGVGRLSESFFLGLRELCAKEGRPFIVRHYGADAASLSKLIRRQTPDDICIFFWIVNPELFQHLKTRRILWMMFESTRLPPPWVRDFGQYDQVWVSSEWARAVVKAHGVQTPVNVIPGGIDEAVYRPAADAREPGGGGEAIRALMVGKYERRKGYDVAFEALQRVSAEAKVTLVAKPDFFLFPDRLARFQQDAQRAGIAYELVSGQLSSTALADLYRSCDMFLFPSRAEGIGLPCMEALACGVPTLATNYSGQSEYLGRLAGLFQDVRYDMVPLADDDYRYFYRDAYGSDEFGEWAEPSVDSFVECIARLIAEPGAGRARASSAAAAMREQFSWRASAARALACL